jgi:hypothetical protein
MADQLDKKISDEVRRVAHAGAIEVLSGKVLSVDVTAMVAIVVLTRDASNGETEEDGGAVPCLLNMVTSNGNGVSMIPAVGAHCIVAEVDGPGKWEVLKASSYTKITMKVGAAEVSVDGVTGKFVVKNAGADLGTVLKDYVQHTMQITVATGAGTSSVPLNISDFAADLAKLGLLF